MSLSLVGIQLDVIDAQCVTDVKLNVQRAVAYIENLVSTLCKHQKPILFVFPEMTTIGYSHESFKHLDQTAELIDTSSSVESFVALCDKLKKEQEIDAMISFSMPRREKNESKCFICNVIVDKNGVVTYYDKLHMANHGDACTEPKYFQRGQRGVCFFDCFGVCVGVSICYDLRFALMWNALCVRFGCDVVVAPAAWPRDSGFSTWHPTLVARAAENQIFAMSVSRAGSFFGASIVAPPWIENGEQERLVSQPDTLATTLTLGTEQGHLHTLVDTQYLKHVRQHITLRDDQREPDVYSKICC
mmetsp:Transcript_14331/g.24520  ORF Transcript_14331/g.24520 Transcript_14331/m.24520 type:complete len:302 (+) Transcript_14331:26-931(+)